MTNTPTKAQIEQAIQIVQNVYEIYLAANVPYAFKKAVEHASYATGIHYYKLLSIAEGK